MMIMWNKVLCSDILTCVNHLKQSRGIINLYKIHVIDGTTMGASLLRKYSVYYGHVNAARTRHSASHHSHRRSTAEQESTWRPRVSSSTSRSSALNPKSTFTESHREHPTGRSGEDGSSGLSASCLSQHPRAAVASATYLSRSSPCHAASLS